MACGRECYDAAVRVSAVFTVSSFLLAASCSQPKVEIPALTPQAAATLLSFNSKAKVWMEHVRKEDPACEYKIELPDQTNHPTTLDVDHAVSCGGKQSPRALDASVTFVYDAAAGHWTISRFSS